jgi:hypothetical protein
MTGRVVSTPPDEAIIQDTIRRRTEAGAAVGLSLVGKGPLKAGVAVSAAANSADQLIR